MRATGYVLAAVMATGCGHELLDESGSTISAVDAPTVTFRADWSRAVAGTLAAATPLRVVYDAARLPQCRGETHKVMKKVSSNSNNLSASSSPSYFTSSSHKK